MQDVITIRGARQHNLKNIDLVIPKNKLVVFTGLSGSGKSSLAFDTIYAEGQRRYVESLSSYARQFLGVMDKPDVDAIDGLSPAISIDQKSTSHNPRSTVGTITEIYDYFRLLFARIGHPHCPNCGREISRQTTEQICNQAIELLKKETEVSGKKPVRVMVLAPAVRDRKGEFSQLFDSLRSRGFRHVRIDGHFFSLEEDVVLIKTNKHSIDVVVDRISAEKATIHDPEKLKALRSRMNEALEQATDLSEGLSIISIVRDAAFDFPEKPKHLEDHLFSQRFACPVCNISLPEIEPRMFSFNSPHGACPTCSGIGNLQRVDPKLVLNLNLSINEGGILPFAKLILSDTWFGRVLAAAAKAFGIRTDRPLREAKKEALEKLLLGTGDTPYDVEGENRYGRMVTIHETFSGVIPEMERRYSETESEYVRHEIGKYQREERCPTCNGKRLKPDALSVSIVGKSIVETTDYSITDCLRWIESLHPDLSQREKTISHLIVKEIRERLSFLISVGLEYLTLSRTATTLSGGEAQRIRLASQIGSGLTGVLYVLDEPSIGLHPRDNDRLIATLKRLRDLGNTVIVVEHDRDIMENSDQIVDVGPGAGAHGGNIVAQGTIDEIRNNPASPTGVYLSGKKIIRSLHSVVGGTHHDTPLEIKKAQEYLTLTNCRENNLKGIDLTIPLKKLVCITGVSGSGKSSLVVDTLYQSLAKHFNPYNREAVGAYDDIKGIDNIKRIILIDQSPIGRTPRSNPATYTGAFTFIRDLFASTATARAKGYSPGRFSFNVKGGRCEACEGEGQTKIEMQFLPDVYVTCDVCGGSRFNSETLEIKFKDKSISQVLSMTIEEALSFFSNIPPLMNKLETLHNVGLSYMQLGQPATQLSGGEAQRIKLATELAKRGTKDTLYILDEPTTGLHFADLEKLLHVLDALVKMDNTVVVIEHNLDIIKNSDWIIDLGPEGGDRGGEILAEGTPDTIKKIEKSYTGQFLKKNN